MRVELDIDNLIKAIKILDKIKGDVTVVTALNASSVNISKSDGTSTLMTSISSYVVQDGRVTIPSGTVDLIKRLNPGELAITDTEIKTKTKTVKFMPVITTTPADDFIIWEEAFRTTERELHRVLEVKYAVAQGGTRPILCGVYFNQDETCALDGYRLSIRKGSYNSGKSFVVDKKTIEVLDSILDRKLDREVIVNLSTDQVRFTIPGEGELVGKLKEGTFIKYEQLIPNEFSIISKVDLVALKDEIGFMNSAKANVLKMKFMEELLELRADQCEEQYDEYASKKKTEELQKAAHYDYREKYDKWATRKAKGKKVFSTKCPEEKIIRTQKVYKLVPIGHITSALKCSTNFKHCNKDFEIAFNPKYISEALKTYKEDIEFRFNGCASPLIITKDGKNLELVLPIRMK